MSRFDRWFRGYAVFCIAWLLLVQAAWITYKLGGYN